MALTSKNPIDINTLMKIAPRLPSEMSVMLRGPTGIGKSQVVQAIAKTLDLPVIDVRGSTMDEAKVTGIPDFEAGKAFKKAMFLLPSWYVRACQEPVVLFLDEMNRANPQVLQAFFQVVLDRCLGNDANGEPMPLHAQTRVFAATNFGAEYDVQEMDPALVRRFWTVDIEPDVNQWCAWATGTGMASSLVDFIRQNPVHWRVDPAAGKVAPGQILPNPASWDRFAISMAHMGVDLDEAAGKKDEGTIYTVLRGFVGTEAAISFVSFLEKYQNNITVDMLLDGKVDASKLRKLKQADMSDLIEKVGLQCKEKQWSKSQVENLVNWFREYLPGELQVMLYNTIVSSNNLKNVIPFHSHVGSSVVDIITKAKDASTTRK